MNDPFGSSPIPRWSRRALLSLPMAALVLGEAAHASDARAFLRLRHSWCPYALPAETTLSEIESVAKRGFDAVGISFVGPYNGGGIDFSTLDAAVALVAKHGARAVLHLAPRFSEADRAGDVLNDGTVLAHVWNRSPNYSVADIFDPRQRGLFHDYLRIVAKRYGKDPRVAGFALGWGYMGETGFFFGDFLANFSLLGAVCAGYSDHALREFNAWRSRHGMTAVDRLPVPSPLRQSDDYARFQRFRSEWVRDVFQKGLVAAVKEHTSLPVGIFGYIAANPNNYARCWQSTPNADFYRSAASASSFDITRTLLDSGVGWEDAEMHDGKWDFTFACLRRDEARQIARGGAFHAMHVRVYETETQWERGVFDKVCDFLRTQPLARKVHREPPQVALFQPTWGVAALPAESARQPFLPNRAHSRHLTKMIGLVESFGLPYRLITETDLIDRNRLRSYKFLLVPMWDALPRILEGKTYRMLARDRRVVPLPLLDRPYTRTEFRDRLKLAGIPGRLDFDAETILAGRFANLVYNWTNRLTQVRIPESADPLNLAPHEYRLIG